MEKDLFYFVFRDKPAGVLLALLDRDSPPYASILAKEVDCTYPHIVKILAEFNKRDLIKVSSVGRTKPLVLTPKGRKITGKIKELRALCK